MHEQAELVNQPMRDELPNQFTSTDQPQISLHVLPYCSDNSLNLPLNVANAFVAQRRKRSGKDEYLFFSERNSLECFGLLPRLPSHHHGLH
jgi:hypothetical protein